MDFTQLVSALMLLGFFLGAIIYARAVKHLGTQLDRMEAHTQQVARDLQASIERADEADSSVPGKSADAALRTGE